MKFLAILFVAATGIVLTTVPARAASPPPPPVNWTKYDTGTFVASTVNQLHTRSGLALADVLIDRYGVTRYAVWEELQTQVFFIRLQRTDGRTVGALIYQMGWPRPMSFSRLTSDLGIPRPTQSVRYGGKRHTREFLGVFAATPVT
ncbi:MAG: hypothetical protein PVSMB7_18820 [Chloroflexota bacterium]